MEKRPSSMNALLAVRVAQSLDDRPSDGVSARPRARHVGDHIRTGKTKILRDARLTSAKPLAKNKRRSRQPPLSHFGRPRLPHPPPRDMPGGPVWGTPWTNFRHSISRYSRSERLPRRLSPASPGL